MSQSAVVTMLPEEEKHIAHVLIVDDDSRNLDVLESILTEPGYRLHRAQDAQEALLALLDKDFAAILLDVRMPVLNGVELAHLIKLRKRTQSVPIIFLTAHRQDETDVLQGYKAGAVEYLTKPVNPEILKTKIAVFADMFRKNRELAAAKASLLIANAELESRVQERTEKLSFFAAIIESSEDAIISKDLNSIITSWNRGAQQIFGYEATEVIGKPITILMPANRQNEEPRILERIRRGERIEHYETIRQRKDGTLIEISLTVSPIRDQDGKVVGVSKIVRDITSQKQTERELAQAHQKAVAASRAKDEFLAALSHELRTPLNPVLLLANDGAQNPEFPAAVRGVFASIQSSVELETQLIDDLLDITRVAHGKLTLNLAAIDIYTVLKEAVETVEAEFVQKRIALLLPQIQLSVIGRGDAVRLKQVMWNILKNAVKFTPTGGNVKIEADISPKRDRISLKITDSGIGLSELEIGTIFNAFIQGEHATKESSQRFGGLGLGLAISRMLVELHSGRIYALSEGRGSGSTFVIELPILAVREKSSVNDTTREKPVPQTASNLAKRILLVEDHEFTRTTLTHLLRRRKHTVVPSAGLTEALEIASHETFDVVIADIGLADGDGYTLMSKLHADYGLRGIALTGYGTEEDIAHGKKAGFINHILKPVRIDTLEAALKHLG